MNLSTLTYSMPLPRVFDTQEKGEANPNFFQRYLFNGAAFETVEQYDLKGQLLKARKVSYGFAFLRGSYRSVEGTGQRQLEGMLGFRFAALGGNVSWLPGRGITSVGLFKRFQLDVLSRFKRGIDISADGLRAVSSLKLMGSSLAATGAGQTVCYDLLSEHLDEAMWRLKYIDLDNAIEFLKRTYPHIDERIVGKALQSPALGYRLFVSELALVLGLDVLLGQLIPDLRLKRTIEAGSAYALSNLIRGAFTKVTALKVGGAIAEGLPVAAIHYGVSTLMDTVTEEAGWNSNFTGRWVLEDALTLAAYRTVKSYALKSIFLSSSAASASTTATATAGAASVGALPIAALVGSVLATGGILYASQTWKEEDYLAMRQENTLMHQILTA